MGYINSGYTTEKSPSMGFVFVPINGESSFKLRDYSVHSATSGKMMMPNAEYLQKLNDSTDVEGRFTYVSEEYVRKLMAKSWDDSYLNAVGWWNWDSSWKNNWKTYIQDADYTHKCSDAEMTFPIGTAFLGLFSGNNNLQVTSSGEAPAAKSITFGTAQSPFICNFVPRTIDINEIVVDSTIDNKMMMPNAEYLQKLNDSTDVTGRYTYLSEAYVRKLMAKSWDDSYLNAVGWWEWDSSWKNNWKTFIQNADYTHKITSMDIEPGRAFLGLFNGGNGLRFTFPNSMDAKPVVE